MSFSTASCSVVVLQQQQECTKQYLELCKGETPPHLNKATPKNCTVVENGRVVVKPIQPEPAPAQPEQAS